MKSVESVRNYCRVVRNHNEDTEYVTIDYVMYRWFKPTLYYSRTIFRMNNAPWRFIDNGEICSDFKAEYLKSIYRID